MNKLIIIHKDDGSIGVVHPAIEDLNFVIKRLQETDQMTDNYSIVDKDTLPTDRCFRNAWGHDTTQFNINRPKAELIQLNRLRTLRNKQLSGLDIDLMKALETNDSALIQTISQKKQQLRDMPTTVDLASVPLADLETYKPTYLEGNLNA